MCFIFHPPLVLVYRHSPRPSFFFFSCCASSCCPARILLITTTRPVSLEECLRHHGCEDLAYALTIPVFCAFGFPLRRFGPVHHFDWVRTVFFPLTFYTSPANLALPQYKAPASTLIFEILFSRCTLLLLLALWQPHPPPFSARVSVNFADLRVISPLPHRRTVLLSCPFW